MIFKNTLIALFSLLILTSCDIYDRKAMEKRKEDRANYLKSLGLEPYNQYGTVYRIGNFGGVPVMLDESFGRETKESAEGIKYIKQSPETFDKLISSLDTEFRYTDGAIYVRYHTAPQDIVEQRDTEEREPNNTWVKVRYENYYDNDSDENMRMYRNEFHVKLLSNQYKTYVYSHKEYNLDKYVLDKLSKERHHQSLFDDEDIYIYRDNMGNYIDRIECNNNYKPILQTCELFFPYKMEGHIRGYARFQRVHLKDWQKIKQMSIDRIESVMVKDKDILKRIEERHRVKP